ncbi:hypothetical protein [Pediococcus acidilactici]|uniref:Uncharacterized protein n=1 Tax=Pediococcus acidilactici TaxID=1254 RepID=A0AAW8YII4_PEDAC|nr:hypothetical protein [Pediococcus acidilactici]MDV2621952.1 hypothetical protein [Pediococcus acidilactici]
MKVRYVYANFENKVKRILERWTQYLCQYHKGETKDVGNGFSSRIVLDDRGYKVIFKKENAVVDSLRIKYCPFCGKKLVEKWRLED